MIFTEEGSRLLFCLAGTGLSAFLSSGPGCEVCTGGSSADVSRAQVAFPKMISGQGDSADQIRKGDRSLAACTVLYCTVLYWCHYCVLTFRHSWDAWLLLLLPPTRQVWRAVAGPRQPD